MVHCNHNRSQITTHGAALSDIAVRWLHRCNSVDVAILGIESHDENHLTDKNYNFTICLLLINFRTVFPISENYCYQMAHKGALCYH